VRESREHIKKSYPTFNNNEVFMRGAPFDGAKVVATTLKNPKIEYNDLKKVRPPKFIHK
jgi:hypothetical protein